MLSGLYGFIVFVNRIIEVLNYPTEYTKGLFGGVTMNYIIISGVAIDYLEVK